jgi:hypothetical protein
LHNTNCFNNYNIYKCLRTTILIFIERGSDKDSMPNKKGEKNKQGRLKLFQKKHKIWEDLKPNSLTKLGSKKRYRWKKLLNNISRKIRRAE